MNMAFTTMPNMMIYVLLVLAGAVAAAPPPAAGWPPKVPVTPPVPAAPPKVATPPSKGPPKAPSPLPVPPKVPTPPLTRPPKAPSPLPVPLKVPMPPSTGPPKQAPSPLPVPPKVPTPPSTRPPKQAPSPLPVPPKVPTPPSTGPPKQAPSPMPVPPKVPTPPSTGPPKQAPSPLPVPPKVPTPPSTRPPKQAPSPLPVPPKVPTPPSTGPPKQAPSPLPVPPKVPTPPSTRPPKQAPSPLPMPPKVPTPPLTGPPKRAPSPLPVPPKVPTPPSTGLPKQAPSPLPVPPKVPTPPSTGPPKQAPSPLPPLTGSAPLNFPAVLAFGDSVADTGNNNYVRTIIRANFPPYGKDFPGHKATGRFSDGKVSVDFLASALGVKELLPPYLKKDLSLEELKTGVSFASAGSGYDNSTCRTMSALTMERQLELFKEYKAKVGGTIPDKTLYILVWGSNDIVEHFTFADGITEPNYADFLVQRAIAYIQSLVDLGAKRIALTGVPPVGCLPSQRMIAGGIRKQCATDRNQLAIMFNRKVDQEMAKLNAKLPGVTLVYIDLYGIVTEIVEKHEALGFKNGKDACCGYIGLAASVLCNFASPLCPDPSKYVFWDSYHPTEAAYKVIIDMIVDKYFRFMH